MPLSPSQPAQHLPEQLPCCWESWGISQGCCFTFVFQLAKLLAQGQAHDHWWGLMESIYACWHTLLNWAGASKHGRSTDSRDVTHSLLPCCLGQMQDRAGQQKQTSRHDSQLTCQSCTNGKQALAHATDVSWYPSLLTEDLPGKSQAPLRYCLKDIALEGCWGS